jgi:hypothetical protein
VRKVTTWIRTGVARPVTGVAGGTLAPRPITDGVGARLIEELSSTMFEPGTCSGGNHLAPRTGGSCPCGMVTRIPAPQKARCRTPARGPGAARAMSGRRVRRPGRGRLRAAPRAGRPAAGRAHHGRTDAQHRDAGPAIGLSRQLSSDDRARRPTAARARSSQRWQSSGQLFAALHRVSDSSTGAPCLSPAEDPGQFVGGLRRRGQA